MKIHLLNTGFCAASEHHLLRGVPPRPTTAAAICILLEHPTQGLVLFDTGYAPRVLGAFAVWPFSLYGRLTPVTAQAEWSAAAQLERLGFHARDVRVVIASHLHADHIGGLRDFPAAQIVLTKSAQGISRLRGWRAMRHAFVPDLLPPDFETRALVLEDFVDAALEPFGATHDLFGDGTLRLVELPGHARGQLGAYLNTENVLLVADGAWSMRAIRDNHPPHALPLRAAFDNADQTLETLGKLHRFHLEHPAVRFLPTHCPQLAALVPSGEAVAL